MEEVSLEQKEKLKDEIQGKLQGVEDKMQQKLQGVEDKMQGVEEKMEGVEMLGRVPDLGFAMRPICL